jgi:phosphoserine phosphatase RsbU/P
MLGDVLGKGIAAALLVSHLHAVLRATIEEGVPLVAAVERANRMLFAATSASAFATLVAARLQPDGKVELCIAGHTPPILLGSAGPRVIAGDGLPLGLFGDVDFSSRTLRLDPGDGLLLYTDGLTEGLDRGGEEMGVDGLPSLVASAPAAAPERLVEAIADAAEKHRGGETAHDDLTILTLRRQG